MAQKVPQLIIMLTGALLIIVGVYFVGVQVNIETERGTLGSASRSITADPASGKFEVSTTYPGLIIIVIGAALEVVGFVASRPWKRDTVGSST